MGRGHCPGGSMGKNPEDETPSNGGGENLQAQFEPRLGCLDFTLTVNILEIQHIVHKICISSPL